MADGNREIRAMLFSVLHLPPLPAIVSRVDRDDETVLDDGEMESSHSLLAGLIDWCAIAQDLRRNAERMARQFSSLSQFKEDIGRLDLNSCKDEEIYSLYCHHTREWFNCYNLLGESLRFKPLEYITKGDKLHTTMCDYTRAQYYHMKNGTEKLELDNNTVSYTDLLRKCAEWTKHQIREV